MYNSKQIVDLNVKHKAITLLEENKGQNIWDLELGKELLHITPKACSIKEKKR